MAVDGLSPASDPVTISNEFTSVEVRKVTTRNGELLEVRSRKLGFVIYLDPLELEALTWQDHEHFSRLLETPYGPEEDTGVRPLTALIRRRSDEDA
jgi:hypothetical protein